MAYYVFYCHSLQGMVNDEFSHIQTLKTVEEPDRVVQLISAYCNDVEAILLEFTSCMYICTQNSIYLVPVMVGFLI